MVGAILMGRERFEPLFSVEVSAVNSVAGLKSAEV